jgi:AAA domain
MEGREANEAQATLVTPATVQNLAGISPRRLNALCRSGRVALPQGIVGMLVAEGGLGKTGALLQLALAVAIGGSWLGTYSARVAQRVLVVLGEEDEAEVRRRLYDIANVEGILAEQPIHLDVLPLVGISAPFVESDARGGWNSTQVLTELCERAKAGQYAFVTTRSRDLQGQTPRRTMLPIRSSFKRANAFALQVAPRCLSLIT